MDILISLQSLAKLDPTLFQNAGWIRMHHQLDNVSVYKQRIPVYHVVKIAQLLVDEKYANGDERFFLYIDASHSKIKGPFTKEDFQTACTAYLSITKNADIKDEQLIKSCDFATAKKNVLNKLMIHYGN
jgi:hypothetical protein